MLVPSGPRPKSSNQSLSPTFAASMSSRSASVNGAVDEVHVAARVAELLVVRQVLGFERAAAQVGQVAELVSSLPPRLENQVGTNVAS